MRLGLRSIQKRLHKSVALRVGEIRRDELPHLAQTTQFIQFGEPERLPLPSAAAVFPPGADWIQANLDLWKEHWPRPFVCELADVKLLGQCYLGVADDGRVIGETTRTVAERVLWPKLGYQTLLDLRALRKNSLPRLRGERYLPLFHVSEDSYFHWFNDVLPVLQGARVFQEQTGAHIRYLIRRPLRTWQAESLSLLGVDPADVELWRGRCVVVPRLLIVSVRTDGWTALPSIASAKWLRHEFLRAVPDSAPTRSLYVRRGARRPVMNSAEVMAVVRKYGVEPVDCGRMSLRDQIRTFKSADVIVGSHGAGLTNMIFSRNARVLEVFGPWKNLCYAALATGLGHRYQGLDLMPHVGYHKPGSSIRDGFKIDVDLLESRLVALLGQSGHAGIAHPCHERTDPPPGA